MPQSLYPEEKAPIPTEQKSVWALQPVWSFERKSLALAQIAQPIS
jgi:hypothetical protein